MLSTCDVPRQLDIAFSMEKPNVPLFGASTPRHSHSPRRPSERPVRFLRRRAGGRGTPVPGSNGGGTGLLKSMVAVRLDGGVAGVILEM